MKVLAVILARAGSAGLRDKHLLPLLGRPVISYTFDHAAAATRLCRVALSTDCPRLRRLADAAGVETIDRPAALATAAASVQDCLLHALDAIESRGAAGGAPFRADALVLLYGNVPVRAAGLIDRAVALLAASGCDSVRSFCPVGKWHPAWMSRLAGPSGDVVEPLTPGSIHRRQDLDPLVLHDGGVVAVTRSSMLRGRATPNDPHAFFGADRRGFEVGAGDNVEIDAPRDLYYAEAVLRERQATVGQPAAAGGRSHQAGVAA